MLKKILIIRLSSLGDIILACSALETLPDGHKADWIVAREYAEILNRHPKINRVFEFDRKEGLKGWIRLCQILWKNQYQEIYDLHGSLRSRFMRTLFFIWGLVPNPYQGKPYQWYSVSKQRLRLSLFYIFKKWTPQFLLPKPLVFRFSRSLGGTGSERPCLNHLVHLNGDKFPAEISAELMKKQIQFKKKLICIMPSSKWQSKNWPVENYVQILKKMSLEFIPIILGGKNDDHSIELCHQLEKAQIPFISGVAKWNLTQVAAVLSYSKIYFGGDTGLAHLAEAVGASSHVIFGPTHPKMGFGPWRETSQSIQLPLACNPCGKDGRYCYRFTQKYFCLKGLTAQKALEKLNFPTVN